MWMIACKMRFFNLQKAWSCQICSDSCRHHALVSPVWREWICLSKANQSHLGDRIDTWNRSLASLAVRVFDPIPILHRRKQHDISYNGPHFSSINESIAGHQIAKEFRNIARSGRECLE